MKFLAPVSIDMVVERQRDDGNRKPSKPCHRENANHKLSHHGESFFPVGSISSDTTFMFNSSTYNVKTYKYSH